jgi:hypothetical protein
LNDVPGIPLHTRLDGLVGARSLDADEHKLEKIIA